ncbi:hypothetical protein E2C01_077670 [Portunus trituberculatus]|uniref:Uncharacterized protein n=1 Tax=Portunus trituberculatus TaxID=210409 RepID=A0A5B7IC09_PORTR|nr:hypothetical protein [Portunus trituberculatus]
MAPRHGTLITSVPDERGVGGVLDPSPTCLSKAGASVPHASLISLHAFSTTGLTHHSCLLVVWRGLYCEHPSTTTLRPAPLGPEGEW